MLHVCGVTFDHSTNYGSCLQAYALQTAISSIKIHGEPCEYTLVPATLIRRKEEKNIKSKSLKRRLKNRVMNRIKRFQRKQFESFDNTHFHFADCHDRADLQKLNQQFDAFVCGSDVIWNFTYTKGDSIYFLDFADKYKFSYAASLGKALPDQEEELLFKQNLQRLDGISVREEYAKGILSQYTDKEIEVSWDPTLLLIKEDWMKIADKHKPRKKYIFAYSTSTRPNYISFLKKLQKQTGLPVVQITWMPTDMIKQRTVSFPTPQHWLTLLSNAEYVVTNSFHGTAFSVIFQKVFFVAIQGERNVRNNVRLYDFLAEIGLYNRLYPTTPDVINLESPDYTIANQKILEKRETSIKYIKKNLECAAKLN